MNRSFIGREESRGRERGIVEAETDSPGIRVAEKEIAGGREKEKKEERQGERKRKRERLVVGKLTL